LRFERVPAGSLQISHIETLQVVSDDGDGFPLIAGKPTVVRVYLDCLENCVRKNGFLGTLHAFRDGKELPGSPMTQNLQKAEHAGWKSQQPSYWKTLNFHLPQDWLQGTIRLDITVENTVTETDIVFTPGHPLKINYVTFGVPG
jgi:hypothetical protein